MDEEVLNEVIKPLLSVDGRVLIAISTPTDVTNHYTEMTELRDAHGELISNVLHFFLQCKDCQRANKLACPHLLHLLPQWKSAARHFATLSLLGDRADLAASELMGIVRPPVGCQFKPIQIESIVPIDDAIMAHTERQGIDPIYVSIDPADGGKCEMALLSGFFDVEGCFVIAALDAKQVPDTVKDPPALILSHFKLLRARYRASMIVVVIEANRQIEANQIEAWCKAAHLNACQGLKLSGVIQGRIAFIRRVTVHQVQAVGMPTEPGNKEEFVRVAQIYLDRGAVLHTKEVMTATAKHTFEAVSGTREQISRLKKQLSSFVLIDTPYDAKNPFKKRRMVLTGKPTGNDDVAMAFLLGLFYFHDHHKTGKLTYDRMTCMTDLSGP